MEQTEDGRWLHRIRQSGISEYDMCPERWRLNQVIDQHPTLSKRERDGAALGTACHAAVEACLLHQISTGEPLSLEDTLLTFEETWYDTHVDMYTSYSSHKAAGEIGHKKVEVWYNELLPQTNPLAVEHTFDLLLFEDSTRVVYLTGTVDVVSENEVIDWKFPKGDYTREKWRYQRASIQASVYTWAMEVPALTFGVVHGTTYPSASTMTITRNEDDWAWMHHKVRAMCANMESAPRPLPMRDDGWWCSDKWCDAYALCKGQHVGSN
mgnify:CR=1 FL=1